MSELLYDARGVPTRRRTYKDVDKARAVKEFPDYYDADACYICDSADLSELSEDNARYSWNNVVISREAIMLILQGKTLALYDGEYMTTIRIGETSDHITAAKIFEEIIWEDK